MMVVRQRTLLLLALLGSGFAFAAPPELALLKDQKDAAVERAVAPINERYLKDLERLLTTLTSAGELDRAVAVKKAMENVASAPLDIGEMIGTGEDLEELFERRAEDFRDAVAPIDSRYVTELEKLQANYTREGNIEAAKEARDTKDRYLIQTPRLAKGVDIDELTVAHLDGTEWEFGGIQGEILKFEPTRFQVFKPDGNGGYRPGDYRNWKIEDPKKREIRIFWHYGEEVATINSKLTEIKDTRHVIRRIVD